MIVSAISRLFVLLLFLCTILCSCNRSESRIIVRTSQTGDLKYRLDTIKIDVDDQTSYQYNRFTTFDNGNDFYLITYNRLIHRLEFFSIKGKKLSRSISLERGGEHGIGDIQNMHVRSLDSIFVFDAGNMKIINERGEVSFSLNLFEKSGNHFRPSFADFMSKPFFNEKRNSVIFHNALNRTTSAELINPFIVELDMETREFKALDFLHEEFFLENKGAFGPYAQVNVTPVNDEMIIYNYQIESSIFRQNTNGNSSRWFDGAVETISRQANTFTDSQDYGSVTKYRHETAQYYNVLYDPFRQLYYRIHRTGKPFDKSERNVLRNTIFYLSVFDSDLKFLKELELGSNIYTQFSWFVAPQGLCLNAAFSDYELLEESKMILHAYDFYFD